MTAAQREPSVVVFGGGSLGQNRPIHRLAPHRDAAMGALGGDRRRRQQPPQYEVGDEIELHEPAAEQPEEPEMFPYSYVEEWRRANGMYRQRAQRGDPYAQRFHTELVQATGRLADPTDLPFDETHLDDPDALTAALEGLLARKPHVVSRRPRGDIGQGVSACGSTVDLAAILRRRAR